MSQVGEREWDSQCMDTRPANDDWLWEKEKVQPATGNWFGYNWLQQQQQPTDNSKCGVDSLVQVLLGHKHRALLLPPAPLPIWSESRVWIMQHIREQRQLLLTVAHLANTRTHQSKHTLTSSEGLMDSQCFVADDSESSTAVQAANKKY